jgi:hypothetical protein
MTSSASASPFASPVAILSSPAVDSAIEEMVFIGGTLNLKLLGGAHDASSAASPTT